MKAKKILTIITIMILIAILSVASFMGVYKLKDYRVKNVVPNYLLGKEFSKSRVVNLEIDNSVEETKIYDKDGKEVTEKQDGVEYTEANGYTTVEKTVNSKDSLTKENYKKAKNILLTRMRKLGVEQYNIELNEETGNIKLDITENDKTDGIIANLLKDGTFELKDSDTDEVLLNNSNIKDIKIVYGQTDEQSTSVYMQIKFNEDGTKKLEEISKKYIEIKKENSEDENKETAEEEKAEEAETGEENSEEEEEETEKKYVSIDINGEPITTTYFGETIPNGILNIPMGTANDNNSLQDYVKQAKENKVLIDSGIMPIKYTQTNEVKNNSINIFANKIIVYSVLVIAVIVSLFLLFKFKSKGILAIMLQIGYIAVLLLALRYTNVKITIGGIIGIAISIIINYIYIFLAFNKNEEDFLKGITAKFALRLIPLYVIAIVCVFINYAHISSFGMTLFWGIAVMYLFNLILTQITTKALKV